MDTGSGFFWDTYLGFEGKVVLEEIGGEFGDGFESKESAKRKCEGKGWDGEVAAMDEAWQEFRKKTGFQSLAAKGVDHGAGVPVQIRKFLKKILKNGKIVGIKGPTIGGTMGGNDVYPEFKWESEIGGVSEAGIQDRQGHFSTCMSKKRDAEFA